MNHMLLHRKLASFVVVSLLLSAQLLPSIALACEGAEVQKISFKRIESGKGGMASGTKKCPENAAKKVEFTVLTEWCEWEVKNENATEKVEISNTALKAEKPGCEKFAGNKLCIEFATPTLPMCSIFTNLNVGGKCFDRLEYINKPAAAEEVKFSLATKSTGGAVTPFEEKIAVK